MFTLEPIQDISKSIPKNNVIIIPKIKPSWPHYLPNITFNVIKINSVGSKLKRQIKLTEFFILNVQNNTLISKVHHYLDISKIWIKDDNLIIIVLKENNEKITYFSPIAGYIVQQIAARIYFRKSFNNKTSFYSLPIDNNNKKINKIYMNPHINIKFILDIQMEIDEFMIELTNEFAKLLLLRYEKGIINLI